VKSVCKQSSASECGKYVFFEVLSLVLHVMYSIVYTVIRTIALGVGSQYVLRLLLSTLFAVVVL